jgi:hypothetical protein
LYSAQNFMVTLHTAMMGAAADFAAQFEANIRLLRRLAGQLIETILSEKSRAFSDDDAVQQVQAWQRDTFLRELRSAYRREQNADPLSQEWIVRTAPALEFS